MTKEEKKQIKDISKRFAKGIGEISGSTWLIVDPLSAYLNVCGFKNTLSSIPETDKSPMVLVMTFSDGSTFIPAGGDLANNINMKPMKESFKNWMWI